MMKTPTRRKFTITWNGMQDCVIQGDQHGSIVWSCPVGNVVLMILSVCLVFCRLLSIFFCWGSVCCVHLFLVCVLHSLTEFYFLVFYLTSGKLPPVRDIDILLTSKIQWPIRFVGWIWFNFQGAPFYSETILCCAHGGVRFEDKDRVVRHLRIHCFCAI